MAYSPIMIVSTLLGSLTMGIIQLINHVVPDVYMDEQFHVDQMAHYCVDDFVYWNAKLSTPPGLYMMTYPATWASKFYYETTTEACSVTSLRLLNGVWIVLLHQIVARLLMGGKTGGDASKMCELRASLIAVNIVTLPVFYMSTWLYYTDLLSTIAVLLMYAVYAMRRRYSRGACAVLGLGAVAMRQTNVVWVVFVAALDLHDTVIKHLKAHKVKEVDTLAELGGGVYKMITKSAISRRKFVTACVVASFPFLVVGGVCASFVVRNGGLAFGDKSAHQPHLHLPQLLYMAAFIAFFGVTQLMNMRNCLIIWTAVRRHKLACVVVGALCVAAVYRLTYAHEYLLADNRHYTFYIWRRLLNPVDKPFVKYAMIPAHLLASAFVVASLAHQHVVWLLGYCICSALVTVPNLLLEFRYFIIPYMLWRMHCIQSQTFDNARLVVELLMNVVINLVVLYMFLYRPFEWTHEEGVVQRFMW